MNQHYEAADTYMREGQSDMALVEATLALAYEQRTAILFAYAATTGEANAAMHADIKERLGLA